MSACYVQGVPKQADKSEVQKKCFFCAANMTKPMTSVGNLTVYVKCEELIFLSKKLKITVLGQKICQFCYLFLHIEVIFNIFVDYVDDYTVFR